MLERSRSFLFAASLAVAAPVAQAQQQSPSPAFVLVERTETSGPESIQAEYAKLRLIAIQGLPPEKKPWSVMT